MPPVTLSVQSDTHSSVGGVGAGVGGEADAGVHVVQSITLTGVGDYQESDSSLHHCHRASSLIVLDANICVSAELPCEHQQKVMN